MAQSFKAASLSLGEAERLHNGKKWDARDIAKHQKYYNLNPEYTKLNTVLKSVDGKNEREVVNEFFNDKMLELNREKMDKVKKFNEEKAGTLNPRTGKPYRKKSVDKREMYAVGKYAEKGGRKSPYDVMKENIIKGNVRGKDGDSSRIRTGVLQQFIVGFGNTEEWHNDGAGDARKILNDAIHDNSNPQKQVAAKKAFEDSIIKPYLERFKHENPSLPIVQAVVHYDETNPHLQFSVLPHVAGKEYGGLGSVSYTGALSHDHPDLKKDKVVTEFYQREHEQIRDLMQSARPLVGLSLGLNTDDLNFKPGNRPGSHKSLRVDAFSRQSADFERKMKWVAKKAKSLDFEQRGMDEELEDRRMFIDSQEYVYKAGCVDVIAQLNPNHRVTPEYVKKGENGPSNVSSDVGRAQHMRMPSLVLSHMASDMLLSNYRTLEKWYEELKERERDYRAEAEKKAEEKARAELEPKIRAELEPKMKAEYKISSESIKDSVMIEAYEAGKEKGRAELLSEEKAAQQSYITDYQAIKPDYSDLSESKTDYSTSIRNTRTRVRNAQIVQNEPKPKIKPKKQGHEKKDDGPDL